MLTGLLSLIREVMQHGPDDAFEFNVNFGYGH